MLITSLSFETKQRETEEKAHRINSNLHGNSRIPRFYKSVQKRGQGEPARCLERTKMLRFFGGNFDDYLVIFDGLKKK